jgi:hypothetical protein
MEPALPDLYDPATGPHPGFGPMCDTCGAPVETADHGLMCPYLAGRRDLWAEGWVDLNAFRLPSELARGWPEVQEGPIAVVAEGGLGPEGFWWSRRGPWVRQRDASCPTHRRVAALAVLHAAGEPSAEAVTKVLTADTTAIDDWRAPALAIDTTGCGRAHHVKIDRGLATAPNHSDSASHKVGPAVRRFTTSASCTDVIDRWNRSDVGTVIGDMTGFPVTYERTGHNPAVFDALRVIATATVAAARCRLIETGEPDRWLDLGCRPIPLGSPAKLLPSTRRFAIALVEAPPTWLWTDEPLR